MVAAVTNGKPGTAMKPFDKTLSAQQIEAVVDYIRIRFMLDVQAGPGYHTLENGWPEHALYRDAFPFATGEIPLDKEPEDLTEAQKNGLRLYLKSCVSCHDRSTPGDAAVEWTPIALSYPRPGFRPGDSLLPPDAVTGASRFARHDVSPAIAGLNAEEREGQVLFQDNCAFCHAADGTGRNWIGTFLQPPPRDLTDGTFMRSMTRTRFKQRIRDGLPGTSMPAWKSVLSGEQIDAITAFVHHTFHPLSAE